VSAPLPATRPYAGPPLPTTVRERLPRCCPVSHNPLPGSRVTIRYTTGDRVLDVLYLQRYLAAYVGGLVTGGRLEVRDMEAMVARIAADCARARGVGVWVQARPLGGLLWLADQHGISVSTDSTAPVRNARCADWRTSGARCAQWRDTVGWWRAALAGLRETPYYRRPPCPPRTRQLSLLELDA